MLCWPILLLHVSMQPPPQIPIHHDLSIKLFNNIALIIFNLLSLQLLWCHQFLNSRALSCRPLFPFILHLSLSSLCPALPPCFPTVPALLPLCLPALLCSLSLSLPFSPLVRRHWSLLQDADRFAFGCILARVKCHKVPFSICLFHATLHQPLTCGSHVAQEGGKFIQSKKGWKLTLIFPFLKRDCGKRQFHNHSVDSGFLFTVLKNTIHILMYISDDLNVYTL